MRCERAAEMIVIMVMILIMVIIKSIILYNVISSEDDVKNNGCSFLLLVSFYLFHFIKLHVGFQELHNNAALV